MPQRILITGGAGFVGSNLAMRLLKDGFKVRIIDDFSTGNPENLKTARRAEVVKGDILDSKALSKAMKGVDKVVHLAAQTSVLKSVRQPGLTNRINSEGTLRVLMAARDSKTSGVIAASSCAVYGDGGKGPRTEKSPIDPLSPYATSKVSAELYCRTFKENFGLDTAIIRPFNIFGPRQDPDSAYASVVPRFIRNAMFERPMTVFGDGRQTRDFVFVDDVVDIIARLLKADKNKWNATYNIATGSSITVLALAEAISSVFGEKPRIIRLPARPGDVRHSSADSSLVRSKLGLRRFTGLKAAISSTVDWYVQNQD